MRGIYMQHSHVASLPLSRKSVSSTESATLCWIIVILASLAAVAIIQPVPAFHITGIAIVCGMAVVAVVSPWLGILALFPLAFSVATPPDGIGSKEIVFALLTGVIALRSIVGCILQTGMRDFLRSYALPILCGAVLLGINLIAAIRHHVPLSDWLRGAAPFVYLFMAAPIAIALRTNPERIKWLGIAVLAVGVVFCVYILGYYATHHLWEYRWYLKIGRKMIRVSEAVANAHASAALGPFVERITALVPSSTDALIPMSLAMGFVLATLADVKLVRVFGIVLMALALPTILVTYTRSMLLSPLLVMAATGGYLAIYRRDRLKRAIVLLAAFAVYGMIVIEALGLELAWLNRGSMLFEALKLQTFAVINTLAAKFGESHPLAATVPHPLAVVSNAVTAVPSSPHVVDDNVSTRIDEYRVAWKMFLDHPAIGNGLGAKHAMSFVRSTGDVLHENVAYVHNWPLYMLMAAGLVGFVAYAFMLIRPVACRYVTPGLAGSTGVALRAGLCTLAIYALFFAVVRLITFNLLVAAAWGVFLAFRKTLPDGSGRQAADASIARP